MAQMFSVIRIVKIQKACNSSTIKKRVKQKTRMRDFFWFSSSYLQIGIGVGALVVGKNLYLNI